VVEKDGIVLNAEDRCPENTEVRWSHDRADV
jgi:hypothetical protein